MSEYETLLRRAIAELGKPTLRDEFYACLSLISNAVTAVTNGICVFEATSFHDLHSTYIQKVKTTDFPTHHKNAVVEFGTYKVNKEYPISYWETQEIQNKDYQTAIQSKPNKVFNNKEELLAHLQEMVSSPSSPLVRVLVRLI